MSNPFRKDDRVIVTSGHALHGSEGIVTGIYGDAGMILVSINGGDAMQWHWSHFELVPEIAATDIVADAIPRPGDWISESDEYMLRNSDDDFYFSCGCWSGAADHYACTPMGNYKSRYGCSCGVPDDCYCHESCSEDYGCAQHVAEWRESIVEDHAEAILMDINRNLWN